MALAMEAAQNAAKAGETPVGAVIVSSDGDVLAALGNAPISSHDPTAHAEIRAIRAAAVIAKNYRLTGTSLYVTLEPCAMCAGAISHARVSRLVIAASDPKGGAVWHGPKFFDQPTCHWRPEIIEGPFEDESSALLKSFFKARRRKARSDGE
ncbi:MAG: nucleoside deaminase [Parvularculaceae bacterium]|nr:MAG: nucleoside deaminase [Parvularculaceae bacterium]